MRASILIISKNRKEDLGFTLNRLKSMIDLSVHEVLVLLDGCDDGSEALLQTFNWVNWTILNESIGASKARNQLYKKADGTIFIGFDDDAHPLQDNFIEIIEQIFKENNNLGIIGFQEIKGVFENDTVALSQKSKDTVEYLCNDFVGCGFAIEKDVYFATNGFPVWIDIYGEESCVAIEVLELGKDILYTNQISVNHRVDKQRRLQSGANYFRFENQLKNTAFFYMVYYKNPSLKIIKLLFHNLKKYAFKDFTFFQSYFSAIGRIMLKTPKILKYRKPVPPSVVKIKETLPSPVFH